MRERLRALLCRLFHHGHKASPRMTNAEHATARAEAALRKAADIERRAMELGSAVDSVKRRS